MADVVNVALLRFLSAQRREAALAEEQASTGEIRRQYQRVKQHRRVSDSSAYYGCTLTCCVTLRKSLPFSSLLYMAWRASLDLSCPSAPLSPELLPALHRTPGRVRKCPATGRQAQSWNTILEDTREEVKPSYHRFLLGVGRGAEGEGTIQGITGLTAKSGRCTWSSTYNCETPG